MGARSENRTPCFAGDHRTAVRGDYGAIFSTDTMMQVGQARLHGASEAGDPQAVQVKAAPVCARDIRPDQLRDHRPTVSSVIDLSGEESCHAYEPPTREITEPGPYQSQSMIFPQG